MDMPLGPQIISPVLVGREPALAALERAFEDSMGGHGRLILIAGEAGIGKSRLAAEARARSAHLGFRHLVAQCFEPDRALPYASLLDLLQQMDSAARGSGTRADEPGDDASALAGLLRALSAGPISESGDPEQERRRLVRALGAYLVELAAAHPLLLVFEDLHWADDLTRDVLLHVARLLASRPLVLLLTYRIDEPRSGLGPFLAELDRGRLATTILLAHLNRASVDAMLRAIFALERPVRADVLDPLYTLTDGNPFFIEELLATLVEPGAGAPAMNTWPEQLAAPRIPRTAHDAVLRRLAWVSPPAQWVLTLAAVAGRRFDFGLLQELTGQAEAELLRHLAELIAAQLVVEESAEQFAFRHALTREAVYAQLLARERRSLHRAIAETLMRRGTSGPESVLPDLAYHCHAAEMWTESLRYARQLGMQALTLDASQAAIEHFSRAIEAERRLGRSPSVDLHRGRGRAHEIQGDADRAWGDYAAALAAARTAGDGALEWQGLLDLGFLWLGRDYPRAGDAFAQALALAERHGDPRRLAHSLNRLGNWHVNLDQPEPGQVLHRRALTIFEALDDEAGIAQTLDLLALATYFRGDRRGGIAHFEGAAKRYRALGDRRGLSSVLAALTHLRHASRVFSTMSGADEDADRAREEGEEAVTIARALGWRAGEAYALSELAACLAAEGEYGRALATAREGLAIAEEIEHGQWQAVSQAALAVVHLDLLDPEAALPHAERSYALARAAGSPFSTKMSGAILAAAHQLAREPERAATLLHDLLTPDAPIASLTDSALLLAQGELWLESGEPVRALGAADRLIAWADATGGPGVVASPWALRGEALAAVGHVEEAEAALRAALGAARAQGSPAYRWRVHLVLGDLLRAQARRDEAAREYAAGRHLVEQLATRVGEEGLRERFLARALGRFPPPRPSTPRQTAREASGGLTAREREVVAQIAMGRSNREIAAALYVSERTIEAHTGHIRDKLGLTSRAQVVAWAIARGLARDAHA
ncbi:MAG TPA: AAA family ATPase [Thermomicrobiaceae bacterium]|nr:AAA family ATPase [Thermomicrobiaceae bacterium]